MANTYSYPCVEDYIEIIAGYKDVTGKLKFSIFHLPESPISLARYDIKVVESFAEQAHIGTGFTDRQAKLAADLVVKYERQLFKLGVDITPVKDGPVFRLPIREIDRTSRVWLENEKIYIKFPYNADIIEKVRKESKISRGSMQWNPTTKAWTADLTEYNVNWMYSFATAHQFEIDPKLKTLMDSLIAAEQTPYKIELQAKDQLLISNAEDSLTEFVNNNLGGFELNNLLTLVDYAPILGYTVEPVITETVIEAYSTRFWSLCSNKELKIDPDTPWQNQVSEIVRYATATNRFPIYVYEPDQSNKLAMLFIRNFTREEIVNLDNQEEITDKTKLVYCTQIPKKPVGRIPLMVSSAGMLFGGDRQIWIQSAEKVVYFTTEVYNKNKQGRTICKLN